MEVIKFDENIDKSYFVEKNFNARWGVPTIDNNMIASNYLIEFHYQVSLLLHLYSSLYIQIRKKEIEFDYNINKLSDLVEKLNIKISDDESKGNKLYEFIENTFIFYYKTFERYISNPDEMYEDNLDNPVFGYYDNKYERILNTYISNMIPESIINMSLNKYNIDNLVDFGNKFRDIIKTILNQNHQNIMGFLLYQKIFYNVILFNINIQNFVRLNYLNNVEETYLILEQDNQSKLNKIINITNNLIKDRTKQIALINFNNFKNNDYLLEKNRYKDKIKALENVKKNYNKTKDRFNLTMTRYKNNVKTFDKLKIFSYGIIILIVLLVLILSILLYLRKFKYIYFSVILVILIIITYIYYIAFDYINEKFATGETDESIKTVLSNPNNIDISTSNSITISKNYEVRLITFNDNIFFQTSENKIRIKINNDVVNNKETRADTYAIIGKGFLGMNLSTDIIYMDDNIYTPEDDIEKLNYYYNKTNYKGFKNVKLTNDILTKIYYINPLYLSTSIPSFFRIHLEFSGGTSVINKQSKPPIIMILFRNIQDNKYSIKYIYIYNGGSYYDTLPTIVSLRNINKDGVSFFDDVNTIPVDFNSFIFSENCLNSSDVYNHIADIEYKNRGIYINQNLSFENINNGLLSISSQIANQIIDIKSIRYFIGEIKNIVIYIYEICNKYPILLYSNQIYYFNIAIYAKIDIIISKFNQIILNPNDNYNDNNIYIIYYNSIKIINEFITNISKKYKQKLKYEIISSLNKLRTEINGDKIDEEITFIKKYVISEEGFNCFNKKVFICETNNIINSVKNIISSLRDLEGKKSKLDGRLPVDVSNIYNTALNIKNNLLSGGTILTQEQTSIINTNYSNIEILKNNYIYNCYFFADRCSKDIEDLKINLRNMVIIYGEAYYNEINVIKGEIMGYYNISQKITEINHKINNIILNNGSIFNISPLSSITISEIKKNNANDKLSTALEIKNRLSGTNFMTNVDNDVSSLATLKTDIQNIKNITAYIPRIIDRIERALDFYESSIKKYNELKDNILTDEMREIIDKIKIYLISDDGNHNSTINCQTQIITNNLKSLLKSLIDNSVKIGLNSGEFNNENLEITYNNIECYNNKIEKEYNNFKLLIDYIRVFNTSQELKEYDNTSNRDILLHSKYYNDLFVNINNYVNETNNLFNNMRLNVYTIGNKSFAKENNMYLYNIYLNQKKDIDNFKINFNKNLIKTEEVDKDKNLLYNIVFSLIVFCIIILIGINIYIYVYNSIIFNAILVVFLMIFLIIYNIFKIVQPTRMANDKFYWFKFFTTKFL